jgi:hypothetical protein
MASPTDIARFRMLIGGTDLTDEQVDFLLENNAGNMNRAGYEYWRGVAGKYAHLVTVTENQSKREMSDLWAHAKGMMLEFKEAGESEDPSDSLGFSGTRAIERP